MPASCCAYNCTNRWHKNSYITFYKFPKNKERRKKWLSAVCRGNWQPSATSKLCSQHFQNHYFEERNGKRFLKFDAVPSIFDFSKNVQAKKKNHRTLKPVVLLGEENILSSETGEMRGCCVPMCKSNRKSDKISFHEMPSNEEQREKWVEAIVEHAPPNDSQWYPDQYDLVCAKHFTADDYRPTPSARCLKPSAVPSMFPDSPACEENRSSTVHFEDAVLELDLQEISDLQESRSHGGNLSGPSAFRYKNLKQIKKGQKHAEKSFLRTKRERENVKKQMTSSGGPHAEAFASQTPVVAYLSRMSPSRTAEDDSVSPANCMHTSLPRSPRLKKETSLLSNEVIYNGQQILQKELSETLGCATAAGVNSFKSMTSYKNFLMKELDSAQKEIADLQACITRLKEENVKLQWEKNSVLITHLHDIKQDAVDGSYDAIVLLNRIVHYSLQRT